MQTAIWLARTTRQCFRDGRKLRSFDLLPDEGPALGLHRLAPTLTADEMIRSYRMGYFPLADLPDPRFVQVVSPPERAIIPVNAFTAPSRLLRTVRNAPYEVRIDTDMERLVALCGEISETRTETWLSAPLQRLYLELARRGVAHSVELWEKDALVGGVFGIAVGGAFCGESMVSRVRDGSKIALVHLARRLEAGGFDFIDCQYISPHLRQFGAIEISRADYERRLTVALAMPARFNATEGSTEPAAGAVAGRAGHAGSAR